MASGVSLSISPYRLSELIHLQIARLDFSSRSTTGCMVGAVASGIRVQGSTRQHTRPRLGPLRRRRSGPDLEHNPFLGSDERRRLRRWVQPHWRHHGLHPFPHWVEVGGG